MLARILELKRESEAFRFGALCLDLLFGTEAVMRPSEFDQFFGIAFIHRQSFGLDIRSEVSADIRSFVPVQTAFLQGLVDHFLGPFDLAFLVCVLDPEQEIAAIMFGDQVFE